MICVTCKHQSSHIRVINGKESCSHCGDFSEVSGHKVQGSITRNSFRVRRQQSAHEGDFVIPHKYNKQNHSMEVNPDFVKLYPDKVRDYFNETEMKKSGLTKLPEYSNKLTAKTQRLADKEKRGITFEGDAGKAMEKILK